MSIESNAEGGSGGAICVINMGEQSRKRIRRLRKGTGRLMEKVEDALAELQTQGVLEKNVQTLVVVVKEERTLANLFDEDDDDDD